MGISSFLNQNIFKTYFPHFVPRGTSNNLQMLNTQNLPTLLYNVHKISVKYTLTQYDIAQYAARSSVVVFLTASVFLRQKTHVVKTKGVAVSSLQIYILWFYFTALLRFLNAMVCLFSHINNFKYSRPTVFFGWKYVRPTLF